MTKMPHQPVAWLCHMPVQKAAARSLFEGCLTEFFVLGGPCPLARGPTQYQFN